MSKKFNMLFVYEEPEYCRVYYKYVNSKGNKSLYCWQDEGEANWVFYKCTADYGEPEYLVDAGNCTFDINHLKVSAKEG